MAGEKRGAVAEAFVDIALRAIVRRNPGLGTVWCQTPPAGISIDTDFSIGESSDSPTAVVLVTVSGSIKDSTRKFWRNLAELIELKSLNDAPVAISVAFTDFSKDSIAAIEAATFDFVVNVASTPAGESLIEWAESNQRLAPRAYPDVVQWVERHVESNTELQTGTRWLATSLRKALLAKAGVESNIWKLENARRRKSHALETECRTTSFKKGLGKLLLFPEWSDILSTKGNHLSPANGEVGSQFSLCAKALRGYRLIDSDVRWVLQSFDCALLQTILKKQPLSRLEVWLEALRDQAGFRRQMQWIAENVSRLSDPASLWSLLRQCKSSPASLSAELCAPNAKRVWLFHSIIDLLKVAHGGTQAFGAAAVQGDLAKLQSDREHQTTVRRILGRDPEWRAGRTIWLGLADWSNGPSAQNFRLYDDDLARVSDVLARRIRAVDVASVSGKADEIVRTQFVSTFDGKVMSHQFDPLSCLVHESLNEAGIPSSDVALPSCFADKSRQGGAHLDPRTATTKAIRAESTIIATQTMTPQGRDHKRKEFAARCVSARYQWDATGNQFKPAAGIKKFVLVLDGNISDKEVAVLGNAGWDGIFYPDEMGRLLETVK